MGYAAGLAVAVGLLWMGLAGNVELATLIYGLIAVLLAVFVAARIRALDGEGAPYWRVFGLLRYSVWLLIEIAEANIAVAIRVLSPRYAISPTLISFRTKTPMDMSRVVLANSVTLTPGTVSIEVEADAILVHVLDERATSAEDLASMERRVLRAMGIAKGK